MITKPTIYSEKNINTYCSGMPCSKYTQQWLGHAWIWRCNIWLFVLHWSGHQKCPPPPFCIEYHHASYCALLNSLNWDALANSQYFTISTKTSTLLIYIIYFITTHPFTCCKMAQNLYINFILIYARIVEQAWAFSSSPRCESVGKTRFE